MARQVPSEQEPLQAAGAHVAAALVVPVSAAAVTGVLAAMAVLLVLASLAGQLMFHLTEHRYIFGLIGLFDLDQERNVPSAFSTLLLLVAAAAAGLVALVERLRPRGRWMHWAVLSGGFVLMAFDESWSFHERLTLPMQGALGWESFGPLFFAWILVGASVALVVGLVYLRLVMELPSRVRRAVVLAGGLYLGGVLGIEALGGWFYERYGAGLGYSLITHLEEGLELAGLVTFVWAALAYLGIAHERVLLRFSPSR